MELPGMNRPARRLFRFSLRGLLVATSVLAVCCSVWIYRAEQQRLAVKYFTSRGIWLGYHASRVPYWIVNRVGEQYVYDVSLAPLRWKLITSADLQMLSAFPRLHELDLAHTGVTDDDVPAIRKLSALHKLSVMETQITAAGVQQLATLPQLEWLLISPAQLNDATVKSLKESARLKNLVIMERIPVGRTPQHSINEEKLAQLKGALPGVKIDLGLEIARHHRSRQVSSQPGEMTRRMRA